MLISRKIQFLDFFSLYFLCFGEKERYKLLIHGQKLKENMKVSLFLESGSGLGIPGLF